MKMRTKKEILEEMKRYFDDKDSFLLEALLDIRDLLESILSELEQKNRSEGILKVR